MPTSSYMPDVEVHIAFNAGYATPAASRTWTDVSQYVELQDRISIAFGRQDERSTAGANQLTLTLDNSDGRFTAGRAASPYYPNVKIGRPIRVRVTPPGGTTVTRFVGFIDEWPLEWEDTSAYAKATLRASSRLARLGLGTKLRVMPEAAIYAAGPVAHWSMGDAAGSTIAAESTTGDSPLRPVVAFAAPPVFGSAIGPDYDGMTAAQFSGDWLSSDVALASGPRTIRASVRVAGLPPAPFATSVAGAPAFGIFLDYTGEIAGPLTTGPVINDGLTHDVMLVRDGATETLYVDGVSVDSAAAPAAPAASFFSAGAFTGVLAHVAVYDQALSAAQAADQASVMFAATVRERTDQRLVRLLAWAGVQSAEVTTQTGVETMLYQDTAGQSVVDALRDCESTEGGVLFDGRDGNVTFHNRSNRYLKSAAVTLNMAAQHVGADYSPKLDRSTLTNDVTIENPTTGESARYSSTSSAAEYGVVSASGRSVAAAFDPLLQKAAWMVAAYAEPLSRVPSLTVDVLAHQNLLPSAQSMLGVNVSDRLDVSNAPTQADSTSASYFVEGYTETIGPESYEITFNLSPASPTLSTFVLQDATRGQLNSTYVLAL